MEMSIQPSRSVGGRVRIPGSKSHTIRGLLVASMAEGTSLLENPLDSADTQACIQACRAMGADIRFSEGGLEVIGRQGEPEGSSIDIDVANSGTTLYLAAGLAATGKLPVRFTGDHQIRSRPIGNLVESLRELGAKAEYEATNGSAPVTISGPLRGGSTEIACPTSQYLSSLLLGCPLAHGDSTIRVSLLHEQPYAEMTLAWLDFQGIAYENHHFETIHIPGRQRYRAFSRPIPGDFSSATFFLCAAAISGGSITLEGLDMEDSQGDKAVIGMLEEMGCSVGLAPGEITISGGALQGRELDLNSTPDALPALAVTAAFAEGTTRLVNVPQARLKETDRISVMAGELAGLGVETEELEDGLVIHGNGRGLKGGLVDGHFDHRVVMAFAVGALGAEGPVSIQSAEAATVTFPSFFDCLASIQSEE